MTKKILKKTPEMTTLLLIDQEVKDDDRTTEIHT